MVIVCIRQMVALGSVSEQFTMPAGLHLGGGGGAGGHLPPLDGCLPPLRFYYIL